MSVRRRGRSVMATLVRRVIRFLARIVSLLILGAAVGHGFPPPPPPPPPAVELHDAGEVREQE
jgi:hypothetical protein